MNSSELKALFTSNHEEAETKIVMYEDRIVDKKI